MNFKSFAILLFPAIAFTLAGNARPPPLGSWPHVHPGMPSGDYSPEWQTYFHVKERLPNVTWPLARNWAGNIHVQRDGHPNNTLFFWAFESSNGSFTDCSDKPWVIWLNGGPGSSSLLGLLFENGPIRIAENRSMSKNPHAWSSLADMVWIDQPVGTGFSTADSEGYINNENQMAADFMGFLRNFVGVFPNLAKRPLYLVGESYAGMYIPYITKAIFEMDNPPVNLARIAIGDGSIASIEVFNLLPVVSVIETYPQLIGYDPEVLEYFREQSSLCGFNLTLRYPQPKPLPTLTYIKGANPVTSGPNYKTKRTQQHFLLEIRNRFTVKIAKRSDNSSEQERIRARDAWKHSHTNRTIDPWYGCDVYDEMIDYAVNFTFPWTLTSNQMFNVYDIPETYDNGMPVNPSFFLNDPRTRAAIHAPMSKDWGLGGPSYPFGNNYSNNDPSEPPMVFLTDLATNATARNVSVIIYSANDDSLIPHIGSQITIQNTTFGGIRGFTRRPETPWYNDNGKFAGVVHQERGWKYVLAVNAGHALGYNNPSTAFKLVREFIFGNSKTGLVTNTESGSVSVIGGEVASLGSDFLRGQAGIVYESASHLHTYHFPTATVKAWNKYMATATPYYSN